MGADEITLEDLLAGEPGCSTPVRTLRQLRADGFPRQGGLPALAAIQHIEDPGGEFSAMRQGYLQILEMQKRAG